MRLEAGEFDRAADSPPRYLRGPRHGFDQWVAMGAALHRVARAMAAQAEGESIHLR